MLKYGYATNVSNSVANHPNKLEVS